MGIRVFRGSELILTEPGVILRKLDRTSDPNSSEGSFEFWRRGAQNMSGLTLNCQRVSNSFHLLKRVTGFGGKMDNLRRNYKQDEMNSRIEEIEVLIKTTMLAGQLTDEERDAKLTQLFKERDSAKKALRNLQLNQARCRRYRARKGDNSENQISGAGVSQSSTITSPQEDNATYFSGDASIDDGSSNHSIADDLSSWTIFDESLVSQLVVAPEFEFLDDLEKNLELRPEELTVMIIRMRKEHILNQLTKPQSNEHKQ
jgi:hypothetical protein